MPIITRLVAGKRNQARVNLYLDGSFAFALSLDEVVKRGLKMGLVITEDTVAELKEGDSQAKVYSLLLNFLSYRPRSVKEVRDRLYKYDVKEPAKQNLLIEKLTSNGYLDDLAFARWFIDSRNTHRPRSARHLTQELQKKGVPREVIAKVSGEFADEASIVYAQLEKKLGSPRKLSPSEKQKIYAYLTRHGFSWEILKEVVKNWESE